MNNRSLSAPILLAVVFSLVVNPPLLSRAEPGVPSNDTTSSTNTPPAPVVPAETTPSAAVPETPAATPTERPATYTIVSGDSLWTIAHHFGCTVVQLRTLNKLKMGALLHPGQVLKIPPAKSTAPTPPATPAAVPVKPSATAPKPASPHKEYAYAQPVQDFDIPASTFASCPVPIPPEADEAPAPAVAEKPAPVAKLVSPEELTDYPAPKMAAPSESEAPMMSSDVSSISTKHSTKTDEEDTGLATAETASLPPAPKLTSRSPNPMITTPSSEWGSRFLQEARALGDRGIEYDEDWCPPGESQSWAMDCSNTARYLYKVTTGIELPRTASDQYYYLHLQNKAWDVPQATDGFADCNFLRRNLKPGDLLFWENTYRPERQPPITHVMVFLGTNAKGQWIMGGSQTSRGGEHNRRNGGPDIYVFDPTKPCGGYTTWLGLVHHQGRFCAYGRPLEADKSKLAIATN